MSDWPPRAPLRHREIYLSCGDSTATGLPAQSIDLVITDPPFFDNVHYSELADFFFAWQRLIQEANIQRLSRRALFGSPRRKRRALCRQTSGRLPRMQPRSKG